MKKINTEAGWEKFLDCALPMREVDRVRCNPAGMRDECIKPRVLVRTTELDRSRQSTGHNDRDEPKASRSPVSLCIVIPAVDVLDGFEHAFHSCRTELSHSYAVKEGRTHHLDRIEAAAVQASMEQEGSTEALLQDALLSE
jgi:hypothetical protein